MFRYIKDTLMKRYTDSEILDLMQYATLKELGKMANERKNLPHIENMIKTTKHSYGVASAIMKICDKLEGISQQNDENIKKICQNDENIEKF